MSDNYKLSFDYHLEYAVVEQSDYLHEEQVFVSRDVNEAFRELLAIDGDTKHTLQLMLKDPEGKTLFHRVLASYGGMKPLLCQ